MKLAKSLTSREHVTNVLVYTHFGVECHHTITLAPVHVDGARAFLYLASRSRCRRERRQRNYPLTRSASRCFSGSRTAAAARPR